MASLLMKLTSRRIFSRQVGAPAMFVSALIANLAVAVLFLAVFARKAFEQMLFLRQTVPTPEEQVLIAAVVLGNSLLLSLPATLALTALTRWGHLRSGYLGYVLLLGLAYFTILTDMAIFGVYGRHLVGVLAFLSQPDGHQAGGNLMLWVVRGLGWLGVSGLLAGLAGLLLALLGPLVQKVRRLWLLGILALPLSILSALLLPTVLGPAGAWVTMGLRDRVAGALPLDLGFARAGASVAREGSPHPELERRLYLVYQEHFTRMFRRRSPPPSRLTPLERRPNVFVVLVESFRADALAPDVMPRLFEWSRAGLRKMNHHAGTNTSESGAFTLMYGQHPLVFHAVLDSGMPAPFCFGGKMLGYECAYFTGHPTVWWRREEFLGPDFVDVHQHDHRGDWPDWDQAAIAHLDTYRRRKREGALALTFLMSTHYEYRYPPEFEKFLPAQEPEQLWGPSDKQDFEQLRNRYKNSAGYVDHVIAPFLEAVELDKDYVIVTGDHAEALGENGRAGHGFDFSVPITHVPFVLRGPGIEPGEHHNLSLHRDIWPTIHNIIRKLPPAGADLRRHQGRRGTLMARTAYGQDHAKATLVAGEHRLFMRLELQEPDLRLMGFENEQGFLIPPPTLSKHELDELVSVFTEELEKAARPILY